MFLFVSESEAEVPLDFNIQSSKEVNLQHL